MKSIASVPELNQRFGIPGLARVCEGNGGLPRVQVNGSFGRGEVYLHGAHVTSWKPAGQGELLFVSTKSRWEDGKAIRGGIPICFPWFRAKVDDPQAPAHGFVRTRTWQLQAIAETKGGIAVTMFTESDDGIQHWFPGKFLLTHRVAFGHDLRLDLVCKNTGTTPLRFEEALHTYNRVADAGHVRLRGLTNTRFLDNIDSNKEKTQRGDVAIASETDNAYLDTSSEIDLLDTQMRRRIRLRKQGSLTTVVWNPWSEGAAALRDLGEGEWAEFLCVEASNILGSAVPLAPGQEHTMTAVLSVETF